MVPCNCHVTMLIVISCKPSWTYSSKCDKIVIKSKCQQRFRKLGKGGRGIYGEGGIIVIVKLSL